MATLVVASVLIQLHVTSPDPAAAQTAITVRDEFRAVSYSGNDGSTNFSSPWRERGETDGPGAGVLRVAASDRCAGGSDNCLQIGSQSGNLDPYAIDRSADLADTNDATLTFTWRRMSQGQVGGAVRVLVSSSGGESWTTLTTIPLAGSQQSVFESFDISDWAGTATTIRFDGIGNDIDGYLALDNVEIHAISVPPSTTTTLLGTTTTTQPGTTTTTIPGETTTTTMSGSTTTTLPDASTTTLAGSTTTTLPDASTTTLAGSTTTTLVGTTSTAPELSTTSGGSTPGADATDPSDAAPVDLNTGSATDSPDSGSEGDAEIDGEAADALAADSAADSGSHGVAALVLAQLAAFAALIALLAAAGVTNGRKPDR